MSSSTIKKILFVFVLLLVSVFSNGQYVVFFAIWVFIAMLLFAVRKLKKWQGFLVAYVAIGIGYYIGFNVVPFLPIEIPIIVTLIFSFFYSIPYLIDSFFRNKRDAFLSTLIFPCSVVLMEFAYHQFNQFGTFGHLAYTQQSQLILLQSISIFGLGYISFLMAWFASICNWIYEQKNNWKNIKKAMLIYGLVFGITLSFGFYRVKFQPSNTETIRIASISAIDSLKTGVDIQGLNNKESENDVKAITRRNTTRLNQNLFDRSIKEAESGAALVFWAEGNAVILKEDEKALYKKASKVASEQNIYLGVGVAVIDPTNTKFLENKLVLFDNNGKKIIDYWKGISVPGAEEPISNNKATGIQKTETDYGTIAAVICFDLDFPNYLKNASGTDILIAPSNDWKEVAKLHTDMSKFRAIEQGFNFVRQTSLGISIGTDYTGEVIGEMNHFNSDEKILITELPTKGTMTIYSRIGDTFIVFCLLLLIFTIIILKKKNTRQANN
ncbi:nitrilase-related carbon-nitrogen hydrolase [Winogradskyella ursingii]|uniref:nitrilase-related carbon-nitrogen hydrolase n=1 Tax=Winogradskyella ursingii TaxID=2686079 RepID=UPI0015CEE014|nr:nitrilase-related carbon-nitrogen hydrolase [Winogradskyella ursingii]